MFYKVQVKDHVRVPPKYFELDVKSAVLKCAQEQYFGFISKELGVFVNISDVNNIGEGIIIPEDGSVYYEVEFDMLVFRPALHEIIVGPIKDIVEFGAFISMGPIEGMIHVSQTMADFVSFAKEKVLQGKETKRVLKVGDVCKARLIAISFKDINNPKFGLTMRQSYLGKLEWIAEEKKKEASKAKKAVATEKSKPKTKK